MKRAFQNIIEMFENPNLTKPRLSIAHASQPRHHLPMLTGIHVARQPSRLNLHIPTKCTTFNTRFFSHNDVHFFHRFSSFKAEHGATEFDVVTNKLKAKTTNYYHFPSHPSLWQWLHQHQWAPPISHRCPDVPLHDRRIGKYPPDLN